MAQNYRYFDDWLKQFPSGQKIREAESAFLERNALNFTGKHACLIGVPSLQSILVSVPAFKHHLMTPLIHFNQAQSIEVDLIAGNFSELPFASGSMDVVILPHVLELSHHPHAIFNEACRIVKPEGYLYIFGFNSFSLLNLWMKMNKKQLHFSPSLLPPSKIRKWLRTAKFQIESETGLLYRPPVDYFYRQLAFLENMRIFGSLSMQVSGVYVFRAKAKVIPVTPMRVQWKQKIADFRLTKNYVYRS